MAFRCWADGDPSLCAGRFIYLYVIAAPSWLSVLLNSIEPAFMSFSLSWKESVFKTFNSNKLILIIVPYLNPIKKIVTFVCGTWNRPSYWNGSFKYSYHIYLLKGFKGNNWKALTWSTNLIHLELSRDTSFRRLLYNFIRNMTSVDCFMTWSLRSGYMLSCRLDANLLLRLLSPNR